jgi:hypothetical protein
MCPARNGEPLCEAVGANQRSTFVNGTSRRGLNKARPLARVHRNLALHQRIRRIEFMNALKTSPARSGVSTFGFVKIPVKQMF